MPDNALIPRPLVKPPDISIALISIYSIAMPVHIPAQNVSVRLTVKKATEENASQSYGAIFSSNVDIFSRYRWLHLAHTRWADACTCWSNLDIVSNHHIIQRVWRHATKTWLIYCIHKVTIRCSLLAECLTDPIIAIIVRSTGHSASPMGDVLLLRLTFGS